MFHSDVLGCMHRDDKRRPGTGDVFVSAGWAKPNEALNGEYDHANDILHSTTTCGERSQTRMTQTARLFNLNFPKTSNSLSLFFHYCFHVVSSQSLTISGLPSHGHLEDDKAQGLRF